VVQLPLSDVVLKQEAAVDAAEHPAQGEGARE
jgi:hypothetical protein